MHEEALETVMAAEGVAREEAERRFFAGKQPTGRFIPAEHVASLIAFLCGPEGADITGSGTADRRWLVGDVSHA